MARKLASDDTGNTTLAVVDGSVGLTNADGALLLTNGEQGFVEPGKAPTRTTGFIANNLLQWCFYYPAVLDLNDLPLTAAEQNDLAASLSAYRTGDLPGTPGRAHVFEATPLKVGDLLYLCTSVNVVTALDPDTGKRVWQFDPKVSLKGIGMPACRGVSHYQSVIEAMLDRGLGIEKYFSYIVIKSPITKLHYPLASLFRNP